jgi:hypothetical protein
MVTLTPAEKAKVARSIRAQYAMAGRGRYIPGPVVRARALRSVLGAKSGPGRTARRGMPPLV